MRQRNGTNGLGSSSSIRGSSKNLHPFLRSSHHDGLTSTGGIARWFMGPAVCTLFSLGKIFCVCGHPSHRSCQLNNCIQCMQLTAK